MVFQNKNNQVYLFLLIAIALRLASGPTANLSYILIAIFAFKGREQALQALFMSWLFSMFNPAIAPDASVATVGRYAVLLAAALSVMLRKSSAPAANDSRQLVLSTLLFGGLIIFHSLFFSSMPDVSVLKAISWILAMATLFGAWSGLADDRRAHLGQQLFGALTLVMLVSLPLLPLPIGYLYDGGGFMGILGHSQSLGITMALLGAWAVVRAVATPAPSWSLIAMIPVCLGLIVLSATRTAAVALMLGVVCALILGTMLSGRSGLQLLPGLRSGRMRLVIVIALAGMVVAWPKLVEQSETFVSKNAGAGNLGQAYQMSRGALIDEMWVNIENDPWQGIGFGIATIPEMMIVVREPVFDLPTGAIVEKGVLPVAVLEELGVMGFGFFVFWLGLILVSCARRGVPALAVFFVAILLNMGESVLFSAGGMGMLVMLMMAWAATGVPMKNGAE